LTAPPGATALTHPPLCAMPPKKAATAIGPHGAAELPLVSVESYNLEIKDDDGFIGDRASKGAFYELLEEARARVRKVSDDPLGEEAAEDIGRKRLDKLSTEGDPEAIGLIQGAAEEFAQRLAGVIRRFLRLKAWRDVQRIVIGGGFRQSRIGELVIGRASVILKTDQIQIEILPIRNHPDEAGLIGCAHLAPTWIFAGHDSLLAVDIGGSNIRSGVVELGTAQNLSKAKVWKSELWRHADEKPGRDEAVARLTKMIAGLVRAAEKSKLRLAPFIGVGCPGQIAGDGSIESGAQNLPGNWESSRFQLPQSITAGIPTIGEHKTLVLMHNDAVVQGLSEAPFMNDVECWAVLTIGTGLGNASFRNTPDKTRKD
jgi:predicted NBD/HSP70 family sugar kinase